MIEEFLKNNQFSRLSNEDKWLYWDINQWVVRSHYYGQHSSSVLYTGESIEEALEILSD